MKLKLVPYNQIENYWEKIKPSLIKMARNWRYEQAYCELKYQSAFLYLTIEDEQETGYVILQKHDYVIHVWAAYNNKNNVLIDGLERIKEIAKKHNCLFISFKSYRKAWEKVAPKLGFKKENEFWKLKL